MSSTRRIHRVRRRAAFARFRGAHSVRGRALRVRFVPPEIADGPASSVAVAYQIGRHFGPAVERNRARRRLRAVFAEMAAELPAGNYLVTPAPEIRKLAHSDLVNTLRDIMTQIERGR